MCTLLIQILTFLRALLPWVPESASSLPRPPLPLGQGSPSTGHPSTSLLIPALTILVVHHCSSPPLGHEMVLPCRTRGCPPIHAVALWLEREAGSCRISERRGQAWEAPVQSAQGHLK